MVYLPHWPIPATLGKREIDYESVFERMAVVLERLDNPQQKLPPVIHVSGTNGKGSAVSLIAKIFSCAGYKTHIYTSPHLHDCNERIVLAGEKISDSFLYEIMEEVRIATGEIPLTFMEAFTIGAFLAFSRDPADVLVVECGMGGRIDITNIISQKIATILTSISNGVELNEIHLVIDDKSFNAKEPINELVGSCIVKDITFDTDDDTSIEYDVIGWPLAPFER
jgi:dihydrofolate synthase/folylpolyglutamate synthase